MNREEKRRFLEQLSIAINKPDLRETEEIYRGFVKFIVENLKKEENIQCPDFGSFILSSIKPREAIVPRTKERKRVGESRFVKFKPDYKVKNYLNNKYYDNKKNKG